MEDKNIRLDLHAKYFCKLAEELPQQAHSSYMTGLFFVVSGSSMLGILKGGKKDEVVEWVYGQLVLVRPYAGFRVNTSARLEKVSRWDYASLASTYSALCILKILGDDLKRVNKNEVVGSVLEHFGEDGCALSHYGSAEGDIRFVYCACCICFILDCWDGFPVEAVTQFILSCQTYEGGFSIYPGFEAHGGGTFCALSSLYLLKKLETLQNKDQIVEWLVMRQGRGFSGRPGKAEDSCYGYWVGLSLKMLGSEKFISPDNLEFYLECQTPYGGFSKYPDIGVPDLTHSYLSLVALGVIGFEGIPPVFPPLGIVYRTA